MKIRHVFIFISLLFGFFPAMVTSFAAAKESLTFGLPPFANPTILQDNFSPLPEWQKDETDTKG